VFNFPRLPQLAPPTNNPVGQGFPFSFPCVRVFSIIVVATFSSRCRSLSSSLFRKRGSVTVPNDVALPITARCLGKEPADDHLTPQLRIHSHTEGRPIGQPSPFTVLRDRTLHLALSSRDIRHLS
jgi:hypothetical protein